MHLPVTYGHTGIGDILVHQFLQLRQTRDAVVHDEYLAIAAHFKADGLGNDLRREGVHFSLYGIAVGRWCLYDAQITGTHQRELQGSRNGRGGERQRIDIHLHLAQLLFRGHTELLLLVDDKQTQVLELHAFANELVRSDEDVYFARFQVGENLLRLLGRSGSGEIIHANGQILQAVGEGMEMLVGQHRRRHHHGHLLAIGSRLEGSPHGHLCLSEAHVATDEPVHRTRTFHIGLHIVGGLELVGGIFIEEAGLQFMLQIAIWAELKTFLLAATTIELNQIAGDIFDLCFRALLHALPSTSPQTVDTWRLALLAFIFRHLVQSVNRDIDNIITVVGNLNHLLHVAVCLRHTDEPAEAADAMIDMHHIVAYLKLLQFLQRQRHLTAASTFTAQVKLVEAVKYLVVSEQTHLQVVVREACMKGAVDGCKGNICARKYFLQAVILLGGVGQYINGVTLGDIVLKGGGDKVEVLVKDGLRGNREA